ncbi:SUKH-4 family immunity protein [Streptomyces sp. NPDC051219]|uniref:SUKH-4 family immunity protein n=1 Tax=Streptomyces sp. NPDC051219 TaxID=3155283 RepID=UPI0034314C7C
MSYAINTEDIIRLFGLQGVVLFPRETKPVDPGTSSSVEFLQDVGLPHDDLFLSRIDTTAPDKDPVRLAERFAARQRPCPPGAENWLALGYFLDSLLAFDPASARVYAFPDGTDRHLLMHRNVESLVYALCALQEFHAERDSTEDEEALAQAMRAQIEEFDALPFVDPISEWNIIYEEIIQGEW